MGSLDWKEVEHEGARFQLAQMSTAFIAPCELKLERHGTFVHMRADLDRDTVLAIAASLSPGPTELPPLVDR